MPIGSTMLHPPKDLVDPLARLPSPTVSTISVLHPPSQGDLKPLHQLQEGLDKHFLEELDTRIETWGRKRPAYSRCSEKKVQTGLKGSAFEGSW